MSGLIPMSIIREDARVLFVDTETTGLNPSVSEILQVALVEADAGGHEEVLLNRFYDVRADRWPEAEKVNGISKSMVEGCPRVTEPFCIDEIQRIIDGADILAGYNVGFDIAMLKSAGIRIPSDMAVVDIMREYSEYRDVYVLKRWKLADAAEWAGVTGRFHDALSDASATAAVWRRLLSAAGGADDPRAHRPHGPVRVGGGVRPGRGGGDDGRGGVLGHRRHGEARPLRPRPVPRARCRLADPARARLPPHGGARPSASEEGPCASAATAEGLMVDILTPHECWRLMGIPECAWDRVLAEDLSPSRLYALAGNAIVVDVLSAVFGAMATAGDGARRQKKPLSPAGRAV